jgi:hypothetical protein
MMTFPSTERSWILAAKHSHLKIFLCDCDCQCRPIATFFPFTVQTHKQMSACSFDGHCQSRIGNNLYGSYPQYLFFAPPPLLTRRVIAYGCFRTTPRGADELQERYTCTCTCTCISLSDQTSTTLHPQRTNNLAIGSRYNIVEQSQTT